MLEKNEHGRPRLVVLTAGGALANMLVNRLGARFGASLSVLKEEPESKLSILWRRARLLGWRHAMGQSLFGVLQKLLQRRNRRRLLAIWQEHGLDPQPPRTGWQEVGSVNAPACRTALRQLDPDVVIVYGTRTIKWRTLGCVAAPFLNCHAGSNPEYREGNAAYSAHGQRHQVQAGVTVHLVDHGVDTGSVLYQAKVDFAADDNILTFQHRQMAAALPLLIRAIEDALKGELRPRQIQRPPRQCFQPTLSGYLETGLAQQVS